MRDLLTAAVNAMKRNFGEAAVLLCALSQAVPLAHASEEDPDVCKWRTAVLWWFSQPSGLFRDQSTSPRFDPQRDCNFDDYSSLAGTTDWSSKRKRLLTFAVSPVEGSHSAVHPRTITV
jgi:hypothetical protein